MPRAAARSREDYFPTHATRRQDPQSDAVAWLWDIVVEGKTEFCFAGFEGRARKPVMRFRYASIESRDNAIERMFRDRRERHRHADGRRNAPHSLAVGDILASSWGYNQTNVDFYQVTALAGRTMVWLREIARHSVATGSMTGTATPVPNRFVGRPFRRRASSRNDVRIASFAAAIRIERRPDGAFDPLPWTAYA